MNSKKYFAIKKKEFFETVLKDLGQEAFWEMEIPDGFGKDPIYEPGNKEYEDKLGEIQGLFFNGWELEMVVNHNWFEEGGQAVTIWLVSPMALERVWKNFISEDKAFFPEIEYPVDMKLHPEDYKVFVSGPY